MDYLKSLNKEQRKAVEHIEGPLLVLAGPGSGKTRVLTYRIAHLMDRGIDPFNILALTFTNKAAGEMKKRVEEIVGSEARNLYIGTFHSVFARILRREADKLGYPNNFTIYDTQDAKRVVKTIIREQELSTDHYKPNRIYYRISLAKNNLMGPKAYQEDIDLQAEDEAAGRPETGKLYELYNKRCFKAGAMDFDDLLFKMYQLLDRFPDVLYKYQHQFRFILIDEFQDTNYTQYIIIKRLGDVFQNICVVGDDAQSIYGFRGANIQNILNFEKQFPDLETYRLEQNYRSTKHIVTAANQLIENNKMQLAKKIWTSNGSGDKIKVIRALTDNEEGRLVAQSIFETRLREQAHCRQFAVLYRTNAQSRAFEEAFRKKDMPYRVFGGVSFYQRKEVKDFLAYLRLIVNPKDEEALKRIINYPPRGIGKNTLQRMMVWASEENRSLWQVACDIRRYPIHSRAQNAVSKFTTMVKSFQAMLKTHDAYELAMEVSKATDILKKLFEDDTTEGRTRFENLEELLNSIKEFTEKPKEEKAREEKQEQDVPPLAPVDADSSESLAAYLQQVSLITDLDMAEEDQDAVSLMTVHAAKGLEFPYIYIVGLEENLFPSHMSMNSREDLEEERRLFYVALTRAKKRVTFAYAENRYRYGSLEQAEPSRFVEEIDEGCMEALPGLKQQPREKVASGSGPMRKNIIRPLTTQQKTARTQRHERKFVPDDTEALQTGMKVLHNRFGEGKVLQVEGNPNSRIATIHFPEEGPKKIMLKYAKLKILDG